VSGIHHGALILLLLSLGCGTGVQDRGAAQARSDRPKSAPTRIIAAVSGELTGLNYRMTNAAQTVVVVGIKETESLVNVGLTNLDEKGARRPLLAEAVPSTENGLWQVFPDGRMETTSTIRSGVRWHDGQPFTSADLLFTYRLARDKEIPSFDDVAYDAVSSVEALSPTSIKVVWKQPFIFADSLFSNDGVVPVPSHLLEQGYVEDRSGFLDLPYWSQDFVGTGPYRLQDFVRGSHILLNANDAYALGRPKIDEIQVRFIADSNAFIANLLAGAVDVNLNGRMSLEQGINVRDQWPDGRMEIQYAGWISLFPQLMTPGPPIIGDARFRRALTQAINRQEMTDGLNAGLVPVAHSHASPTEPDYKALEGSIVKYDYDLRAATQAIESLGYSRDGEGMFRAAVTGERLETELRVTAGRDLTTKSALAVANYWQHAGINAQASVTPTQRASEPEYRATFPGYYMANQPNDLGIGGIGRYHSSKTSLPENSFRVTGNHNRYMNPEFDALIDRYFSTVPKQERLLALGQILRVQTDQALVTGLFYNAGPILVSNRLQGVTAMNQAWNVTQWEVRAG